MRRFMQKFGQGQYMLAAYSTLAPFLKFIILDGHIVNGPYVSPCT